MPAFQRYLMNRSIPEMPAFPILVHFPYCCQNLLRKRLPVPRFLLQRAMNAPQMKNLNEKTNEEIEGFLKKSKEELFNLRFQSATGQLENTARLKAVKHDIARMYTVLRERELGISQAPEATETKAEEK